ncbi:hypothetical protein E4T39_07339 [Aureobasidium subglaciale]|nr:hypothetical protein E4T39_07339 [Aureobasidium subglaciale]
MTDPYQWRESVLSTRSLSYVSNMDAADSTLRPSTLRKNTLTSISSDYAEEDFHDALTQVPSTDNLPPSVSDSPLFRLPRDLRLHIYSHLLTSSQNILWPTEHQSHNLTPQLLRTCRPIYEEAAHVLYQSNTPTFAHPSDANVFAHALSNRSFADLIPHVTLRIRSHDTRLWTGWFNTNAAERSLVRDLPGLRQLTIRYSGPRWQPSLNEKANADLWLKDPKLQEIILSVRKCVAEVRLLLCVRLPEDVADEIPRGMGQSEEGEEKMPHVMFRRWVWLNGCHIRVEPLGRDDDV